MSFWDCPDCGKVRQWGDDRRRIHYPAREKRLTVFAVFGPEGLPRSIGLCVQEAWWAYRAVGYAGREDYERMVLSLADAGYKCVECNLVPAVTISEPS